MINIRMNNVDSNSNKKLSPKITVVGVGGAGGNAVNNMIASNLTGVDFVVCNTDAQALVTNLADHKVQLGVALTEGLGAGAKPEVGREAAQESIDDVMQHLEHANMAFITAGMGGGTGTYGASVIAKQCRERGILTVGVVTKPFHFEGTHRMKMAEDGIAEMQSYVDTLIVIPNQNLFRVVNEKTTFADAFKMADSVLQSAVRSVTDLIVMPGLINLDFADIRSVMQEMGKAVIGSGEAQGDRRATEAAEKAISNPLLDDVSMKGAKGVIINVTGGYDMTLFEVDEACNRIRDEIDSNANIIFGSTFDERMEGGMRVSVVATGIDAAVATRAGRSSSTSTVTERPAQQVVQAQPQQIAARPAAYQPQPVQQPIQQPLQQQQRAAASYSTYTPQPVQQPVAQPVAVTELVEQPVQAAPIHYADLIAQAQAVTQVAQPQPAYAPQVQPAEVQARQEVRGARMGNSFIPPRPVEPTGGYSSYQSQVVVPPMNHMPEPVVTEAPARKKSASLFERITGQIRSRLQDDDGDLAPAPQQASANEGTYYPHQAPQAQPQMQQAQPQPEMRAPQRSVPQNPAQGRLNIDAPSRPAEEENPLDIPAFLRRQSS
jgi:cell division protein FtsZ